MGFLGRIKTSRIKFLCMDSLEASCHCLLTAMGRRIFLRKFPGPQMRIEKCWYCSVPVYPGHGTIFVRNDARMFRFCRKKCRSLFKRRINPIKVKWTKISRKFAGKELAEDKVLEFETRLTKPRIYDREDLTARITAIPRVLELRKKREDFFIKDRILTGQERSKADYIKYIEKHQGLLTMDGDEELREETRTGKKKETQTN
jgi:large subunit ribosomal protein L24e